MIAALAARLRRSPLAAGAAAITAANVIAQGLALAAAPFLARLFDPAAFGVLGIYTAVLGIVGPVAALRYDLAIPIAPRDAEARALVGMTMKLTGAICLTVWAALWVAPGWTGRMLGLPGHPGILVVLLPLGLAMTSLYQVLSQWTVRARRYGGIAAARMAQGVSQVLARVAFGAATIPGGLVLADPLGRLLGLVPLVRGLAAAESEPARGLLRRYRRFALMSSPGALLNGLGMQLPAILLAQQYGLAVAGAYTFGHRLVGAPIALVSQAIGQVFQAELASRLREDTGTARRLFDQTAVRLAGIGVVVAIGAWAAPIVFPLLFGAEWDQAGRLVRVLALAYLAQTVVSPLGWTAALVERQDLEFGLAAGRVGLVGGVFFLARLHEWPVERTLTTFALVTVLTYLCAFALYRAALHRRERRTG